MTLKQWDQWAARDNLDPPYAAEVRELVVEYRACRKRERKARRYLQDLVKCCWRVLAAFDVIYKPGRKADVDRGREVAAVCNALDLANDQAAHFGLGLSFEQMAKQRKAACRKAG